MRFTFDDEFAGVGGFRYAMEAHGGECVCSSEWDKWARKTYSAFHGDDPLISDAMLCPAKDRPKMDILCGGFPCPAFSISGISIRNHLGRPSGFDDEGNGRQFFKLAEILMEKQPLMFLFENVDNISHHDDGRTMKKIETAISEVGYEARWELVNARMWVPQNRNRFFMVGIRKDIFEEGALESIFSNVTLPSSPLLFSDILVDEHDPKYILKDGTWNCLKKHRETHEARGNGFGYTMVRPPFEEVVARTLLSRYHKDGRECLVWRGDGENPRRLTPLECFRLQGFPREALEWFDGTKPQPVSDLQAYRQAGNSVCVPLVRELARNMVAFLEGIS